MDMDYMGQFSSARSDDSFDDEETTRVDNVRVRVVPTLDEDVVALSKIEAIYACDPGILSEDPHRNTTLNLDGVEPSQLSQLLRFYSFNPDVREDAFQLEIKTPLLNLLKSVAEKCMKWPGKAKYIGLFRHLFSPSFINDELLNVAIRDIFSHPTEGLSALREAIVELRDTKNLTKIHLNGLRLFRTLVGFYYDPQALQYLIEEGGKLVPPFNFTDWQVRFAMLRFLQLAGEYFQLLLPSTLGPDVPTKIIYELRNQLAHISRTKLQRLLDAPEETIEKVYVDVQYVVQAIDQKLRKLRELHNTHAADLWDKLKKLPETQKPTSLPEPQNATPLPETQNATALPETQNATSLPETQNATSLPETQKPTSGGYFKDLKDLLDPPPHGTVAPLAPLSYGEEIKKLLPRPTDVVDYFKKREDLQSEIKRNSKSAAELCSALKSKGIPKPPDEEKCQGLLDKIQTNPNKSMADELNSFINEMLGVSNDEHTSQQEILTSITGKRKQLHDLLSNMKACHGHGNLSKKYSEFSKALQEAGVIVNGDANKFHWDHDPITSPVEQLFHKVHRTGITKKEDKTTLRLTRIKELLDMIELLRTGVDIKVDLTSISITAAWSKLPNNQPSVDITTMEKELHKTARGNCILQLTKRIKTEQVKNNYRFPHNSVQIKIMETLTERFEGDQTSYLAHQFLVASIYELLKEINDYPELACLGDTSQVRNHFLHRNPFEDESLDVKDKLSVVIDNPPNELANEVFILSINVKFILEDLAAKLRKLLKDALVNVAEIIDVHMQ